MNFQSTREFCQLHKLSLIGYYLLMKIVLLSSFLLLIFCSCGAVKEETTETAVDNSPDFSKLKPDCFSPYATTPIIGPGNDFFTVDNGNNKRASTWGDPTVLKVNEQFIMYASTLHNDRANDTIEHISVYRLTSANGINWTLNPTTPVFDRTGAAAWNADGVETPSVVFFQNEYHMFYTSYPSDFSAASTYRICHAKSADGISWTRVSTTTPTAFPD